MDARKRSQKLLVNDWALGPGCLAVNERVWFADRDGVRVVCVRNTPFYTYDLNDRVQHLFCACQLIEARLAKQCEVAGVFGVSASSLQRARRRVRDHGIGGLVPQKKGPQRRHRGGGAVGRRIVKLWKKGARRLEIAARLGVSEGTIRNVLKEQGLYPRPQRPQSSLPFAGSPDEGGPQDPEQDEVECGADTETNRGSSVAVEATSIAYASPLEQFAARLGLIEEAPVEFAPARDVPVAGVLLGVALLSTTGLMEEARGVYGRLKNGWYGLRATVWMLFVMALLRIKHPEQLKGVDPAALGHVLGLPRVAEVKTIRRKLRELAGRGRAAVFHRRLARHRARQYDDALAYLYVDGHVRAYSGKRKIGKAYVTSRKSVLRAETDYWVNLSNGQPLLVVHAQANERLTQMMKTVVNEVRTVIGDRRPMIVFDRGGWSQSLFRMLVAEGVYFMTYRKAPLPDWGGGRVRERRLKIDGHTVTYDLADGEFQKKGWPRLRCLAVKRKDGRQTQILCSRYDLEPAELAYRMFGRWKQENWFKYMREQFALDVLVDYATEPDDPDRLVINPTWRGLDKKLKAARVELQKAEAAYGRASLSNTSSAQRERCAAAVDQARDRHERLCQQRRDTPQRVRLGEVSDGDPVKLTYERKLLTDTIKMCAYDVETQLTEMLAGVLCRQDFEGRAVIRELFQTPGDLSLSNGRLHVHFSQLSAPRYTQALMSLCEQLNARDLPVPETSFTLRFHVKPRPENGQK